MDMNFLPKSTPKTHKEVVKWVNSIKVDQPLGFSFRPMHQIGSNRIEGYFYSFEGIADLPIISKSKIEENFGLIYYAAMRQISTPSNPKA